MGRKNVVDEENYAFSEGIEKTEHSALVERVNSLVANATTNASGLKVEEKTVTVSQKNDSEGAYGRIEIPIPEGAVLLNVCWRVNNQYWKTENITWIRILAPSSAFDVTIRPLYNVNANIRLVYAYMDSINLQELIDMRIGTDGTIYDSAGDAIREQIFALEEAIREIEVEAGWQPPSGGIDESLLSESVNESLDNGNAALEGLDNKLDKQVGQANYGKPMVVSNIGIPVPGEWPENRNTKIYGFDNLQAFNNFRRDYPDVIKPGDYAFIRSGNYVNAIYILYEVTQNSISPVFSMNNVYVVTVSVSGGIYAADKTLAQIIAAYNNGYVIKLLTEYGVILDTTEFEANAIEFTGSIEDNGNFLNVTYKIDVNGLKVNKKIVSKVTIELEENNGVYSPIDTSIDLIAIQDFVNSGAVVEILADQQRYPWVAGSQLDVKFGRIDPATSKYILFSANQNTNFSRTELDIGSGGGGGSGGTVTAADIVTATSTATSNQKSSIRNNISAAPSSDIAKTALASGVQSSLDKADAALPKNQGSANSGKPLVVGSDGNVAPGAWQGGSGGAGASENFVRAAINAVKNLLTIASYTADNTQAFADLSQFLPDEIIQTGDVLAITGGVNAVLTGETLAIS